MIVKNEKDVIKRCLNSVKPLIDYWVIVDTGSTDGTQAIILETMKEIPGELHEKKWVNFSFNRNQALELCQDKCDYVLFIDADEEFVFSEGFCLPKLDKDAYLFPIDEVQAQPIRYMRKLLINQKLNWRWVGVLHEMLECSQETSCSVLPHVQVISRSHEGARSKDPHKYLKDAALLEEALKGEPNNGRYVYYLAQSYLNAGEYAKALKNFQKRLQLPGVQEELFMCLYISGYLQEKLGLSPEVFIDSYWRAFHFRPTRLEPLFRLADYYKRVGYPLMGYLLANYALSLPYPNDTIFIETWIYDWGILVTAAECSASMGNEDAGFLFEKVFAVPNLPSEVRELEEQAMRKVKFFLKK